MPRPRNDKAYGDAHDRLLESGVGLIRSGSFSASGISEILAASGVPKGSFYHHFSSKEAFGLAVARHYHAGQLDMARTILGDASAGPLDRLRRFFETAYEDFRGRGFEDGCLMCNLSTELADQNPAFQSLLAEQWAELSACLAGPITQAGTTALGLAHLSPAEAADWLLNSWSGALTRMKAEASSAPLDLFLKSVFPTSAPARA